MRFITLTDKCVNFEFSQTTPDILKLVWNVPHDFSEIPYIGIHSFYLSELKLREDKKDSHIRLSTNLIARTITNPTRNILDIRIPKNSVVAECRLNTSKSSCVNICLCFANKNSGLISHSDLLTCGVDRVDQIVISIENVILNTSTPTVNVTFSLNNA